MTVEDAFGSGHYKNADAAETSLSISWLLEGKQRRERVNSAKAQSAVLEVERDIGRVDAAADTARLYITALALQIRKQQAQEAIQFGKQTLELIQKRIAAGNSPAAEAARANIELAGLKLEQEDLEHQLLVIYRQLAAQWGVSQADFTSVEGRLDELPEIVDFTELQKRIQNNPRIRFFVTKARVEESQMALIKAQAKPQWRISAGVKHLAITDDQALMIGVSRPLGIFDRQQGRVMEARALMELNRAQQEAETLHLETQLFDVYQEMLHSMHVANTYRKDILPALEKALSETRKAYDMGRYSYLEWQSLQRDYLAAKNILIDATTTAHLNAIEIERLTGTTPHTDKN